MSIVALVATIVAYVLCVYSNLVTLPIILMIISFIIGIIDLVMFYNEEKPIFSDFARDAFRERFGSSISVVAGVGFILLLIFV